MTRGEKIHHYAGLLEGFLLALAAATLADGESFDIDGEFERAKAIFQKEVRDVGRVDDEGIRKAEELALGFVTAALANMKLYYSRKSFHS